eukprot:5460748-Amphidinium_carterae.2
MNGTISARFQDPSAIPNPEACVSNPAFLAFDLEMFLSSTWLHSAKAKTCKAKDQLDTLGNDVLGTNV